MNAAWSCSACNAELKVEMEIIQIENVLSNGYVLGLFCIEWKKNGCQIHLFHTVCRPTIKTQGTRFGSVGGQGPLPVLTSKALRIPLNYPKPVHSEKYSKVIAFLGAALILCNLRAHGSTPQK